MEHTPTIDKLTKAMAAAQKDFKDAERDRDNPFFDSTYSTMAAILAACREAMAKNGIAVFQATEDTGDEHITVTTMLSCEDQWLKTALKVRVMAMVTDKGDRETGQAKVRAVTPQAMGSASTYACRYALRSLVVVASEDDDGNAGSGIKPGVGAFQDAILNVTSETKQGKNKKPFTIFRIETAEHGELATFNEDLAKEAEKHKGTGQIVDIEGKKNEKGYGIDLIRIGAAGVQEGVASSGPRRASEGAGKSIRTFNDSVEEIGSRPEGGNKVRWGIRTANHEWVGTYDEKLVNKARACLGTNGICRFELSKAGSSDELLTGFQELTPDEVSKLGRTEVAPA